MGVGHGSSPLFTASEMLRDHGWPFSVDVHSEEKMRKARPPPLLPSRRPGCRTQPFCTASDRPQMSLSDWYEPPGTSASLGTGLSIVTITLSKLASVQHRFRLIATRGRLAASGIRTTAKTTGTSPRTAGVMP
ncbi:hypothetical protein LX36DRAFT_657893 [Colletotrichum falcatum]|nr:hypothetical protein LX36DRAFT_657893 [Colletotrichum falcatum]